MDAGLRELHAVLTTVRRAIFTRHLQCRGADIDRVDLPAVKIVRQADRDISGSAADIKYASRGERAGGRQRLFHENFSLRPWNEHAGVDLKFQSHEFRFSEYVLKRLA